MHAQRLQISTQDVLVPKQLSQAGGDVVGWAGRAENHVHAQARARMLRLRCVRGGWDVLAQIGVLRVTDDADDLVDGLGIPGLLARAHERADWLLTGKISAHERLVHEHHLAAGRRVRARDVAAREDRHAQRVEVAGAHPADLRRLLRIGLRVAVANAHGPTRACRLGLAVEEAQLPWPMSKMMPRFCASRRNGRTLPVG